MMVNHQMPQLPPMAPSARSSRASWPESVPRQMPWMNSYEPVTANMQFGHTTIEGQFVANPLDQPAIADQVATPLGHLAPVVVGGCPSGPPTLAPNFHPLNTSFQTTSPTAMNYMQQQEQYSAPIQSHTPSPQLSAGFPADPFVAASATAVIAPSFANVISQGHVYNLPMASAQFNPAANLTEIPQTSFQPSPQQHHHQIQQQHHACKRGSDEIIDDQILAEEPPTKQMLSETKLFKQFGSLQLNANQRLLASNNDSDVSDDDGDNDYDFPDTSVSGHKSDNLADGTTNKNLTDRQEFNRYVYLLFRDKKKSENNQQSIFSQSSNSALDRLAREERDKLNKAVILWNPPVIPQNPFGPDPADQLDADADDDSDDDGKLNYMDHTDFLKQKPADSVVITEVDSDDSCSNNMPTQYNVQIRSDSEDTMSE